MEESFGTNLKRLKGPFLIAAARGGRVEEVQSLISLDNSESNWINDRGDDSDTALLAAVRNAHYSVVEVLLAHGADVSQRSRPDGNTCLHIAASRGDDEICSLLLNYKQSLAFSANNLGDTPIKIAIRKGFDDLGHKLKYAPIESANSSRQRYSRRMSSSHQDNINSNDEIIQSHRNDNKSSEDINSYGEVSSRESDNDDEAIWEGHNLNFYKNMSGRSMHLEEEYAEFFAEISNDQLYILAKASESMDCFKMAVTREELNAQMTGLWLMVKHFRSKKSALSQQVSSLENQCKKDNECLEALKTKLRNATEECYSLKMHIKFMAGENLNQKSLQDIEIIEKKNRMAYEKIMAAKEILKKKLDDEEHENRMCVICQEEQKSVLLMPCRHLCCCKACSRRQELKSCPLCRKEITQKIDVYS